MVLAMRGSSSLLWLATLIATARCFDVQIGFEEFLSTNCSRYRGTFEPLVQQQLAYIDPFGLDRLLRHFPKDHADGIHLAADYGGGYPRCYIIDGDLNMDQSMPRPGQAATMGFGMYALPVLQHITSRVRLPDMALLYSPYDSPIYSRTAEEPGPWFGYCGVPASFTNLLLPSELRPAVSKCSAGAVCQAGTNDTREGKAVFLGGATGWEKGRRRAVFLEAMNRPDRVYAGLIDYELRPHVHYASDSAILTKRVSYKMSLEEQVTRYKYQTHVEGHCAACRLKYQLASPSAVLKIISHEQEWFEGLLVPYVHYIPVEFTTKGDGSGYSINLADQVEWAEANSEAVERIVMNANAFAADYLSEEGQMCYSVMLLTQYALRQLDPWRIRERKSEMQLV